MIFMIKSLTYYCCDDNIIIDEWANFYPKYNYWFYIGIDDII